MVHFAKYDTVNIFNISHKHDNINLKITLLYQVNFGPTENKHISCLVYCLSTYLTFL